MMRLLSLCILSLAACTGVFASGDVPSWSLKDVTSGWNASELVKTYFHNSELQRQWAWELMGKQGLRGDERVLDFGCGDGKISAEISRLVPQGQVNGVDISAEMLQFAGIKFPAYAYPNLEFQKSDSVTFEDIPGRHFYDIICSFCVFHMISRPLDVLKNFKSHLKPDGRLVLVIPAGRNPVFFEAANDVFAKYELEAPWKNQSVSTARTMRTLEGCSAFLNDAGYEILSLEMIDTDNPFYGKAELIAWMIGQTTANWNIPLSMSSLFFTDLVERMFELDPEIIDQEGRVHFKLSRIHVVATPG
jgi:trans-aconitate 2-methyltransferase